MSDALVIDGLGHSYGAAPILSGVDLRIGGGELVAVLGTSGSGKSTLLRAVAGFVTPSAGTVTIAGEVVVEGGRERVPAERRRVGMVFQDYALFPHMTVAENVAFGLHELPRAERGAIVRAQLQRVGLADRADERPTRLSGGQRQRVALARALAPGPALLLLDEPFANVDADLRRELGASLRQLLAESAVNALLVTHDYRTALGLADRVAVVGPAPGEAVATVLQVGAPVAVYRGPATPLVAKLTGPSLVLAARASGDAASTRLGEVQLSRPTHGEVEVVVRPEHLRFEPGEGGAIRVLHRAFRGASYELTLDTPVGAVTLECPCAEAPELGASGQLRVVGVVAALPRTAAT